MSNVTDVMSDPAVADAVAWRVTGAVVFSVVVTLVLLWLIKEQHKRHAEALAEVGELDGSTPPAPEVTAAARGERRGKSTQLTLIPGGAARWPCRPLELYCPVPRAYRGIRLVELPPPLPAPVPVSRVAEEPMDRDPVPEPEPDGGDADRLAAYDRSIHEPEIAHRLFQYEFLGFLKGLPSDPPSADSRDGDDDDEQSDQDDSGDEHRERRN